MIKKLEADLRRPSPDVARLLATALQIPQQDQAAFIRFTRGEPRYYASSSYRLAKKWLAERP